MAYQIRSNLHHQVFDRTGVTCISPTGENERGLGSLAEIFSRVTCSLPLGRLGWFSLGEGQDGFKVRKGSMN